MAERCPRHRRQIQNDRACAVRNDYRYDWRRCKIRTLVCDTQGQPSLLSGVMDGWAAVRLGTPHAQDG